MKHTGQEVNQDYPSAKIQAFKELCMDEGDYKLKEDDKDNNNQGGFLGND